MLSRTRGLGRGRSAQIETRGNQAQDEDETDGRGRIRCDEPEPEPELGLLLWIDAPDFQRGPARSTGGREKQHLPDAAEGEHVRTFVRWRMGITYALLDTDGHLALRAARLRSAGAGYLRPSANPQKGPFAPEGEDALVLWLSPPWGQPVSSQLRRSARARIENTPASAFTRAEFPQAQLPTISGALPDIEPVIARAQIMHLLPAALGTSLEENFRDIPSFVRAFEGRACIRVWQMAAPACPLGRALVKSGRGQTSRGRARAQQGPAAAAVLVQGGRARGSQE
ncbi:hypothetical protein GY45DRAFT_624557 [Cubamyces sp. BRFM 1775]|nr:hypothetical protein GY45DRAFT_624557 [Cubamyces sp. BRFM 1775]